MHIFAVFCKKESPGHRDFVIFSSFQHFQIAGPHDTLPDGCPSAYHENQEKVHRISAIITVKIRKIPGTACAIPGSVLIFGFKK